MPHLPASERIPERERLERAVAHLESQRSLFGNAVVEAALAPLKEKRASLSQRPAAPEQRKQVAVAFAGVSAFTALARGKGGSP